MRRTIYCQFEFLQRYIEENPCGKPLDYSEEGMIRSRNWFQLGVLLMKSLTVLDIPEKDFFTSILSNQFLQQLWCRRNSGECVLLFSENYISIDKIRNSNPDSNNYDGLYLTMLSEEECKEVAESYGIVCVNLSMALNSNYIYDDFGEAINAGTHVSWDFLEKHNDKNPALNVSNSMIIVDNYLLNDKEKIKRNLFPIFDYLLPQKLSKQLEYHLSIFTTNKDDKLKFRHQLLSDEISRIRPNLKVRISITQCTTTDFHDRAIVTNNIWIGIGKGCDLLNKNGRAVQSTTISIHFPFIQTAVRWGEEAWENLIKDAEGVFRNNHKKDFNFWGDYEMQNRLIQWYSMAKANSTIN